MIEEEEEEGRKIGFGSGVKRFIGLGYHPNLEVRPGTFGYSNISPGCYYSNKPRKIVSKIPSWIRQAEVEDFSKQLGYDRDYVLKKRRWMKSINGPGWQDIKFSPGRTIAFPKNSRFKEEKFKSFAVPGPGTYGKNHVPYTRMEEKSRAKGFSHSNVPLFEQRSCSGRSLGVFRSYQVPPNLYNVKTSIEELLSKRISRRGPYDLFSGSRFPDTEIDKKSILKIGIHPSSWSHPRNEFKGKFQRCGKENRITSRSVLMDLALCPKNPLDPGPNYYEPYPPRIITPSKYPFHSSVLEPRPRVRAKLLPPPGRYNPEFKRRILGDGMKSCFLSKTQRIFPVLPKWSWFE